MLALGVLLKESSRQVDSWHLAFFWLRHLLGIYLSTSVLRGPNNVPREGPNGPYARPQREPKGRAHGKGLKRAQGDAQQQPKGRAQGEGPT